MMINIVFIIKSKKAITINKIDNKRNMKNLYLNLIVKKFTYSIALLAILFGFSNNANAQVKKAFTQRASQYTPNKKVYSV